MFAVRCSLIADLTALQSIRSVPEADFTLLFNKNVETKSFHDKSINIRRRKGKTDENQACST